MPKIDVLANTTSAQRSVKDLSQAFDQVGDSLEDVARDGDRAGDKLERTFKETVQDAGRAEKAAKDLGKATEKAGDDAKRGMQRAAEGTAEFKDEAKSSAREAAASFSEVGDVLDLVQETLANALAGFGPAGAAAGIALAAGLGLGLSQAQAMQEKLAETRETAVDVASTMYEEGGTLPLTDRVNELLALLGQERGSRNVVENIVTAFADLGTNLDAVKRTARETNVPVDNLIKALSGTDMQSTKRVLSNVSDEIARMRDEYNRMDNNERGVDYSNRISGLQSVQTELQAVLDKSQLANDLYNSTEFLNAQRIDDLANAWNNAGVQTANYFKAGEDGVKTFDVGAYIADWEAQIAKADEVKADLLTLPESIKDEAERQWAAGGVAAADAYVDAYQAADAVTKSKLESIAGPQGQAAGRKAAQGFVEAAESRFAGYSLPELNAKLRLSVDDSAWRNWIPIVKTANVLAGPTSRGERWVG